MVRLVRVIPAAVDTVAEPGVYDAPVVSRATGRVHRNPVVVRVAGSCFCRFWEISTNYGMVYKEKLVAKYAGERYFIHSNIPLLSRWAHSIWVLSVGHSPQLRDSASSEASLQSWSMSHM